MRRALLTPVALAFTLAAAGCSSGSNRDASPRSAETAAAKTDRGGMQHVTVHATSEFRFEPATITAHPGMLEVRLIDVGSYPHNLAVAALHKTSDTVTGGLGKSVTTFTMNFSHPGRYSFVCTYHSSAGMRGTFVIR